jgi:hypothetical protein
VQLNDYLFTGCAIDRDDFQPMIWINFGSWKTDSVVIEFREYYQQRSPDYVKYTYIGRILIHNETEQRETFEIGHMLHEGFLDKMILKIDKSGGERIEVIEAAVAPESESYCGSGVWYTTYNILKSIKV